MTPYSALTGFAASHACQIFRHENCDDDSEKESWLNIVEIEIGVLKRQCQDRRIDDREELERERRRLGAPAQSRRRTPETDVNDREGPHQKMGRAYPRPVATLNQPAKES